MILASDVEAPWKILFELVAVGAFLGFLLQFWALVSAGMLDRAPFRMGTL
jgi:hypothetical protein